jgi:rhodanese-related sulfurtransferase
MTRKRGQKLIMAWTRTWCIAALTAAAAMAQSVSAGAENPVRKIQTVPAEISVAQAKEAWEAGAFILDVREAGEWNQTHIPGSTLIPLGQLEKRLAELPKDRQIVIVCRSGGRSAFARDILKKAGFDGVASMDGGMNEWKRAGYPAVSGP